MHHLLAVVVFVASVVTAPVPDDGRSVSALPQAGSEVVYVAGDSIVASWSLADPERDGFAARLRARLCGDRCGRPGRPTVISVAAGGARLTDPRGKDPGALVHTWPSILDADPTPTTIIVGIGINDVALVSDAQFGDAYRQIVFSARKRGIRVIPATMSPCGATLPHCPLLDPQRRALNHWLRSYWGARNVADFSAALTPRGTGTLDPAYDIGDGLHLNNAGTRRIADSVPLGWIATGPASRTPPTHCVDRTAISARMCFSAA